MITVFSTATCAYCKMVKQYLTLKGKEFTEVDLTNDPERHQEIIEKTGVSSVPIVQVGDEFIIGWNRQRMAELV